MPHLEINLLQSSKNHFTEKFGVIELHVQFLKKIALRNTSQFFDKESYDLI